MKATRNPTRRNRNIGTAKQGHGKDNSMVIPDCRAVLWSWQDLTDYKIVIREINNKKFTFIIEKTRKDSFHACTVDDIAFLLKHLPASDLEHFNLIILRQPKRKEELLAGVWGRAGFSAGIGEHCGPAVIIESQPIGQSLYWSKSLQPDQQEELNRTMESDPSMITTKRHYIIKLTLPFVRNRQLYHTVPHEIGHHIDYRNTTHEAWDNKPSIEKEQFAHKYADTMRQKLIDLRVLPFDRILDKQSLANDGLSLDDFQPDQF